MIKIFYYLFKPVERKMVVNDIFCPTRKTNPVFQTVPYINLESLQNTFVQLNLFFIEK